jgi:hypothetical protein
MPRSTFVTHPYKKGARVHRRRFTRVIGLTIAIGSLSRSMAHAANAVYLPSFETGGTLETSVAHIEVQGASGRIDVPLQFSASPYNGSLAAYSTEGATGTDSQLYTLVNSAVPAQNSIILLSDPHSGANLGSIQLNTRVSDIAFTNGQL